MAASGVSCGKYPSMAGTSCGGRSAASCSAGRCSGWSRRSSPTIWRRAAPACARRRSRREGDLVQDFRFIARPNALHVLNAPSPAATASLAIGAEIVADGGGGGGMTVEVESYSGFKADERPLRFRLGERWLAVEEVVDRWYDPDAVYFRVRAGRRRDVYPAPRRRL